jgi:hypothetical protein
MATPSTTTSAAEPELIGLAVTLGTDALAGDVDLVRRYDWAVSADRYCARLERALQAAYPAAAVSVAVRPGDAPTRVYLRLQWPAHRPRWCDDRTDLPATAEQARIERALVERVTRHAETLAERVRVREADAWLVEIEA